MPGWWLAGWMHRRDTVWRASHKSNAQVVDDDDDYNDDNDSMIRKRNENVKWKTHSGFSNMLIGDRRPRMKTTNGATTTLMITMMTKIKTLHQSTSQEHGSVACTKLGEEKRRNIITLFGIKRLNMTEEWRKAPLVFRLSRPFCLHNFTQLCALTAKVTTLVAMQRCRPGHNATARCGSMQ